MEDTEAFNRYVLGLDYPSAVKAKLVQKVVSYSWATRTKRRRAEPPQSPPTIAQEVPVAQRAFTATELAPSFKAGGGGEGGRVLGCPHYDRGCKLMAPCCGKLYVCRLCHDADLSRPCSTKLDMYSVKEMMCMSCGDFQKASDTCSKCGVSMGRYYCDVCKLWENREDHDIYHCQYCNICRVGKGTYMRL